jgi:hypothetical protein
MVMAVQKQKHVALITRGRVLLLEQNISPNPDMYYRKAAGALGIRTSMIASGLRGKSLLW